MFVEAGVAERTQNGENQEEGRGGGACDVCDCVCDTVCGVWGHLCNLC